MIFYIYVGGFYDTEQERRKNGPVPKNLVVTIVSQEFNRKHPTPFFSWPLFIWDWFLHQKWIKIFNFSRHDSKQ
jgi:hypothetical protein